MSSKRFQGVTMNTNAFAPIEYENARARRGSAPHASHYAPSRDDMAAERLARELMIALGLVPDSPVDISREGRALQDAARELAEAVESGVLTESESNALIKVLASQFVDRYVQSVTQDLFQGGALPDYIHARHGGPNS